MADSSLREELTKAFAASDTEPVEQADTAPPVEETSTEVDTSATDTQDTAGADSASDSTSGTTPAPAAAPAPVETIRAPQSWNSEAKALWASLPPAAQKEVQRREIELNRVLQTSSDARRQIQELNTLTEPYKPLMDKHGVTFAQAIQPLLATRALLEVGTKGQKITAIANMMREFVGLDAEGIEMLDSALAVVAQHGPAMQQVQAPQIDYRSNPDLAPLFALAEQAKQMQTHKAQAAVDSVSAEPYFEEVRHTMADLLDMARTRGKTLDIAVAYRQAAQIHGYEVAERPRDAAGRYMSLEASRAAASSVSGSPKPAPAPAPGSGSLRDELERNFNAARRR